MSDWKNCLEEYATLEDGWDGSGSIKPTAVDLARAHHFMTLLPEDFPQPNAMLNSDGKLGLYWDNGDTYVDIEFEPLGISIFSRRRTLCADWYENDSELSAEFLISMIASHLGYTKENA